MAQIALEPAAAPPTGGNGTRTSQARIFRSTQTAPNAGTIADLTTAFGTAANASTSAQYSVGGTATWRRFVPNSVAGTAQDPATVSTASGQGWRDTVAQNANESVIVNAGTWTVRTRLTKTGQTIAADIVVRVVAIVYRVNSSGVHQAEIGRVQMADTTLSTSTLTLSGSFTTASDTAFAAGDKVQVECYVTPVAAGLPAAPAAAVNVNFVVDETSANSGASLTAIPLHRIAYARAFSVTTAGTLAFSRRVVLAKNFSVSGVGSVTDVRRLALAKTHSVSGVGVASSSKRLGAVRVFSVAAAGAAGFSRRLVLAKAFLVTGVGTPEISKVLVLAKQFSVTTVGAPGFSRRIAAARSASVTGVGTPEFSRGVTAARAYSVTGVGTPEFSRLAIRLRSHSVSAVGTAISATSKALSRSFSVASAGTATMVKSLNFDRRFSVAASAVAKMRIEIPEAVLDRMVGGGTTIVNVVKKFFPVFDD